MTVTYRMVNADAGTEIQAMDTFVVSEGKIQSLTIELAAGEVPVALPVTGAAGLNLLPGLLVLGGAALVALGRRFSS